MEDKPVIRLRPDLYNKILAINQVGSHKRGYDPYYDLAGSLDALRN